MINIFRLAYRNVLAHKTKTLIIGILVTLSVFVFVLVNSFLSSVEQGMEKTYRHSLTGDLAIFKNITFDYSMFGTWGDMGNIVMPSIPDYSKVREQVEAHPQVESVLSLSSGFAVLLNNGEVTNEWTVLFGIDPQEYAQMFDLEDTITLVQGRFLQKGEKGVVLPQYLVDKYLSTEGIALEVGQDIYLMSWGGGGNPRIRTLPLVGIYQYNHITLGKAMEDSLPMLSRTSLLHPPWISQRMRDWLFWMPGISITCSPTPFRKVLSPHPQTLFWIPSGFLAPRKRLKPRRP